MQEGQIIYNVSDEISEHIKVEYVFLQYALHDLATMLRVPRISCLLSLRYP